VRLVNLIDIGAVSTTERDIFGRNICINYMKNNKIPEFYIFAENGRILRDRPIWPKMPEFFTTIARKKYFPEIWWGTCPPAPPPSPTPIMANRESWRQRTSDIGGRVLPFPSSPPSPSHPLPLPFSHSPPP